MNGWMKMQQHYDFSTQFVFLLELLFLWCCLIQYFYTNVEYKTKGKCYNVTTTKNIPSIRRCSKFKKENVICSFILKITNHYNVSYTINCGWVVMWTFWNLIINSSAYRHFVHLAVLNLIVHPLTSYEFLAICYGFFEFALSFN